MLVLHIFYKKMCTDLNENYLILRTPPCCVNIWFKYVFVFYHSILVCGKTQSLYEAKNGIANCKYLVISIFMHLLLYYSMNLIKKVTACTFMYLFWLVMTVVYCVRDVLLTYSLTYIWCNDSIFPILHKSDNLLLVRLKL